MSTDRDTLIAYVMGQLSPQEEREVVRYLRQHPEEAAWVRDLFEMMAAVALAQAPAEVPDAAEAALLARIRAERGSDAESAPRRGARPARRWRWGWGLAAAAALLVLAWVAVVQFGRPEVQAERRLEQLCRDPAVVCQTLTDAAGETLGRVARRPDDSLFVVLDEPPPPNRVYQAWEIVGDTPRSVGLTSGRVLALETPLAPESAFGITLEPPGGSPKPTSTPLFVVPMS